MTVCSRIEDEGGRREAGHGGPSGSEGDRLSRSCLRQVSERRVH